MKYQHGHLVRDLGYIQGNIFLCEFLVGGSGGVFFVFLFFLHRFNVSFFGLVSYKYHFCRAKMDVPLPSMLRKKKSILLSLLPTGVYCL